MCACMHDKQGKTGIDWGYTIRGVIVGNVEQTCDCQGVLLLLSAVN